MVKLIRQNTIICDKSITHYLEFKNNTENKLVTNLIDLQLPSEMVKFYFYKVTLSTI